MANRRGRPTKLTDGLTEKICAHLGNGIAFKTALEAEGISERVGHDWLSKGEDGKEPYAVFSAALTQARARGEIFLHNRVLSGGKGSSNAQFVIERRFREHYGRVDRLEHAGHDGGAVKTETTLAMKLDELSVEHLRRLAEAD